MARLAVLGLAVGSLRVINTWDYPTYLGISTVAVLLAGYFRHGGLSLSGVAESAAKALLVAAVGWLAFQPFLRSYETFFTSVETTTNQTVLWQFLVIHGLFVFIIGSYLLRELWTWLRPVVARGISVSPTVADAETETGSAHPTLRTARIAAIAAGVAGLGYVVATAAAAPAGSTVPFVSLILLLLVPVMLRSLHSWTDDSPVLVYVVVMIGVAFAIVFGLDLWRVEGDIDRMNSVFKFYLQVWVLLAVASAYLLWRMLDGRRPGLAGMSSMKWAWAGALAVLFVSASVYPVLGTRDRLRDRFNDNPTPLTLDGEAFIQEAVYRDQLGFIDLAADFEGIEWLRANVQGSPVVLEGHTPTYRWGGRVSIYTGLPSVVGWQWHQEQQRWDYGWAVGDRISDVNRIYETVDAGEAALLLREYDVRYVYLGELERLYYPADGLAKFDGEMSRYLTPIVVNDAVTIYRVVDDS